MPMSLQEIVLWPIGFWVQFWVLVASHKTEWPTIGCNERLTLPAALSQQLAAGMCAGAPLLENRMSL